MEDLGVQNYVSKQINWGNHSLFPVQHNDKLFHSLLCWIRYKTGDASNFLFNSGAN